MNFQRRWFQEGACREENKEVRGILVYRINQYLPNAAGLYTHMPNVLLLFVRHPLSNHLNVGVTFRPAKNFVARLGVCM